MAKAGNHKSLADLAAELDDPAPKGSLVRLLRLMHSDGMQILIQNHSEVHSTV